MDDYDREFLTVYQRYSEFLWDRRRRSLVIRSESHDISFDSKREDQSQDHTQVKNDEWFPGQGKYALLFPSCLLSLTRMTSFPENVLFTAFLRENMFSVSNTVIYWAPNDQRRQIVSGQCRSRARKSDGKGIFNQSHYLVLLGTSKAMCRHDRLRMTTRSRKRCTRFSPSVSPFFSAVAEWRWNSNEHRQTTRRDQEKGLSNILVSADRLSFRTADKLASFIYRDTITEIILYLQLRWMEWFLNVFRLQIRIESRRLEENSANRWMTESIYSPTYTHTRWTASSLRHSDRDLKKNGEILHREAAFLHRQKRKRTQESFRIEKVFVDD